MKLRETYSRWKTHIDRARMYLGYIQNLMWLWILLKLYHDVPVVDWIFDHPLVSIPGIVIVFIFVCVLVGYLDKILGLREEEYKTVVKQNPEWNEMKTKIDEIHKRKIDLSDEVLILNVDGYIGESTRS